MFRNLHQRRWLPGICLFMALAMAGCAGKNHTESGTATGAAVGAVAGAVIGQAVGHDSESTVIGAGVGAVVGAIAGNRIGAYMDQQEAELRKVLAENDAANVKRINDVLTATFKSEVFFDFDAAMLKPGGDSELSRVADVLNRYPETKIRVEGHTDKTGSEGYNMKLSERRAEAVKQALINKGVAAGRIVSIGYGEMYPISSDDAMNRRVSIVITPVAQG